MKEINIGKNIYLKRKEKGITQDELAAYMGVSKASVSKWENGQSYPDITFLPILATYFDISVDQLIGYLPQMTIQDVKKLYSRLSDQFEKESYETVIKSIHHYTKKYYSCYILQFYMALLLLNYGATAKEPDMREDMIKEVYDIANRIVSESDELKLTNQALNLQATAALLLNQPDQVIALLEDQLQPQANIQQLLANAYQIKGQIDKAEEITQYSMYGNMINLMSDLQQYMNMNIQKPELFQEILNRCLKINEIFHVEEFHQNVVVQILLTAATGYMMQNNMDEALHMLERYASVCEKFQFPVQLQGDEFFTKINGKYPDFDIETVSPRNENAIRQSILLAVKVNPVFQPLHDNAQYKRIITRLSKGVVL